MDNSIINEKTIYNIVNKAKKYDELIRPFKDMQLHCSFCGKSASQVERLIAGPKVYICNECIQLCDEIIQDEKQKEVKKGEVKKDE